MGKGDKAGRHDLQIDKDPLDLLQLSVSRCRTSRVRALGREVCPESRAASAPPRSPNHPPHPAHVSDAWLPWTAIVTHPVSQNRSLRLSSWDRESSEPFFGRSTSQSCRQNRATAPNMTSIWVSRGSMPSAIPHRIQTLEHRHSDQDGDHTTGQIRRDAFRRGHGIAFIEHTAQHEAKQDVGHRAGKERRDDPS